MAEINKRNLVDDAATVYAANTLANNPTPLFSTGMPAKIIRASIANTNLLSEDGDLFVGTGDTYTETIDGTEYTYAKIAKKNQSELFVNGLNSTATNVGLAANVGKFIDDRLHISNSTALGIGSIALGYNAKTTNDQAVAIGYEAIATGGSTAIGNGAKISTAITNAIQLGSGTNSTMNSFQVGGYQMLDLNAGKIPLERINQAGGNSTLALGGTAKMTGDTVYGANSAALNGYGVAIGASAKSVYSGDVAVGYDSYCRGGGNVTIGYQASIGRGNEYSAQDCIAIGGYAAVSTKNGAVTKSIQLGIGTNTSGGLKVFDWQLLDQRGIIPLDRRPTYRCKLTKQVIVGGGSGATTRTYVFEWYSSSSSKEGTIFDNFSVFGYEEKVISSSSTNTYNLYNAILKITKNATIDESVTTIYVDDDTNTTTLNGKLSEFTFTAQLI